MYGIIGERLGMISFNFKLSLAIVLILGLFVNSSIVSEEKIINKFSCAENGICNQLVVNDGSVYLRIQNRNKNIPYSLEIKFTKFENLGIDSEHLEYVVLDRNETKDVGPYNLLNPSKAWSLYFNYRYKFGNVNLEPDTDYVYRLPYSGKFRLMQGYDGSFSHKGKNALDFQMPERSKILAAREGVVVGLEQKFTKGGVDPFYYDKANYISILHEDGTLARYLHLIKNGVRVKLGENVKRGQLIGLSGNTGYSSDPHLHFQVSKQSWSSSPDSESTLPTLFQTESKLSEYVSAFNYYWHEDKPLSIVPFLSEDLIEFCQTKKESGERENCGTTLPRGKSFYIFFKNLKPGDQSIQLRIVSSSGQIEPLDWIVNLKKDWQSFYTSFNPGNLPKGKYQLEVSSDDFSLEPIEFFLGD